ncbi:hypothetical protein K1719_039702 [Acacia pycnantha]|nr:hypothetical protein K1719_039702 [Acacia pycnantha]
MACFSVLFCLSFSLFFIIAQSKPLILLSTSPYLSSTTILNYQKMVQNFKVFIYKPNKPFNYTTQAESLFYVTLQNSHFVTQNAEEANLFFVPFSPDLSLRSLARFIGNLRTDLPYWNRALGADHFFLSCDGLGHDSNRNVVELKKNSVQISCFPADGGYFIPHKDLTLPPIVYNSHALPENRTVRFLGYVRHKAVKSPSLIDELVNHREFCVETESSDETTFAERLSSSKFCLFEYGNDVSWIGEALRFGCVPVVIADRPVNDLPFVDVLRWQEMAVFLRSERGLGELKHVLNNTWRDRGERMKRSGAGASKHFVWNEKPEPFDSFNTVMYQLWLRRHTVRYARAE